MNPCHLHVLHAAAGAVDSARTVWKGHDPYFVTLAADIRDAVRAAEIDLGAQELTRMLDGLEEGRPALARRLDRLVHVLAKDLPAAVQSELEDRLTLAYTRGAIDVQGADSPAWQFNSADKAALSWLRQDTLYWIGSHHGTGTSERIRQAMEPAFDQGLSRSELGVKLKEAFAGEIARSEPYWEGLSNHVVTRSRAFGLTEGLTREGFVEAEISAVIDKATTPICKALDGRVVLVKDMRDIRDGLMAAATPEATKEIAPWQTSQAQVDATVAQADLMGHVPKQVALPPYHWNCRTTLVVRRG